MPNLHVPGHVDEGLLATWAGTGDGAFLQTFGRGLSLLSSLKRRSPLVMEAGGLLLESIPLPAELVGIAFSENPGMPIWAIPPKLGIALLALPIEGIRDRKFDAAFAAAHLCHVVDRFRT